MDLDAAFASLPGLTPREAQRSMARAVATALDRERPLLVHAPTGVGKSLGYLVPIAAAGRRAIVATATKALQSQLVDRDLPRLADAFQTTFALIMGRANYACLAKMDALVAATRLAATAQEEAALEVVDWATDSDTGSRLDAPPGTRDDVWDLVSTAGEDCPGQRAARSTSVASPSAPRIRRGTSTWWSPIITCCCSNWSCGRHRSRPVSCCPRSTSW